MKLPLTSKVNDFILRTMFEAIERGGFLDFPEDAKIYNPPAGTLRLYAEDNGAGKTRLVVRNSAGATSVIWTEP